MNNWFVGFVMGFLVVLAYQRVYDEPLMVEVDEIQAVDIIEAYNRGRADALSTQPVSFELEETCMSVGLTNKLWKENEMKTIIHVNQHVIKANAKTGRNDPVLTVKTYKTNTYAHEVDILGPSKVVYSPDKPLSCGAKVWIETEAEVRVHNPIMEAA
jgi:hypothetical protein